MRRAGGVTTWSPRPPFRAANGARAAGEPRGPFGLRACYFFFAGAFLAADFFSAIGLVPGLTAMLW